MSENNDFFLYSGQGKTLAERGVSLPAFERDKARHDPALYLAGDGLRHAVNVALALGQPLLVTGDPGTGKTELAAALAYELELPLVEFRAKTSSTARDLFYRYDALRHFHDSRAGETAPSARDYIEFEALGQAILLSKLPAEGDSYLPPHLKGKGPSRSVVLVDEIDKAPRDLPNDTLVEIERMEFRIHETGEEFAAEEAYRPILVLTSNSEKNLPDPFLRRCVFYHIEFPERDQLREILQRRLGRDARIGQETLEHAMQLFYDIRKLPLNKLPGTAECIAWIRVLEQLDIDPLQPRAGQTELLAMSYCVLTKNREDLDQVRKRLSAS